MRNLALVWVLAGCLLGCGGGGKTLPPDTDTTFTDHRDGKVYKIVEIGSQTWFAENLNYAAEGSKCYNNSPDSCAKYGRLYNWETAMTACPAGTHLPTDKEWDTLVDYVGGYSTAGTKLKSSTGWKSFKDVPVGTDEYGFSALSGGIGISDCNFHHTGNNGGWWSATENCADSAWYRCMHYNFENVCIDYGIKANLYSVRCVQDDEKERRK